MSGSIWNFGTFTIRLQGKLILHLILANRIRILRRYTQIHNIIFFSCQCIETTVSLAFLTHLLWSFRFIWSLKNAKLEPAINALSFYIGFKVTVKLKWGLVPDEVAKNPFINVSGHTNFMLIIDKLYLWSCTHTGNFSPETAKQFSELSAIHDG